MISCIGDHPRDGNCPSNNSGYRVRDDNRPVLEMAIIKGMETVSGRVAVQGNVQGILNILVMMGAGDWIDYTGHFKKAPKFSFITRIVVTCKPYNRFTNCFFP